MPEQPKLFTDADAERLMSHAGEPYQPSNGFEGELFMRDWCARCSRDAFDPDTGDGGCDIIANTMALKVSDPDYPREWQYGADGQPICTAFLLNPNPEASDA
jgi:hypothetical protein